MPNLHVSYLCALYVLLYKIRREGLMAIEEDVEVPERSRLFLAYPELAGKPLHFEFLRDVLRGMVAGTLCDPALLRLYAETGREASLQLPEEEADRALWNALRVSLEASVRGCPPQMAVEFGRQALPFDTRPSFGELENRLKHAHFAWKEATEEAMPPLGERVAAWFARLDERQSSL